MHDYNYKTQRMVRGTLAKLNIGNYIVEQTRKKINSNNFLELAVKNRLK